MTQEVTIEGNIVVLDSSVIYSGEEKPDDSEKLVRKAVGLPVTKQLVFYKNKHDTDSAVKVKGYRLVEMYDISDRWYTVEVILDDNTAVLIHSGFFKEMQKPNFVSELLEQEKETGLHYAFRRNWA